MKSVAGNPEKLRKKIRTRRILVVVFAILSVLWIGLLLFGEGSENWSMLIVIAFLAQLVSNLVAWWTNARLLKDVAALEQEKNQ